MHSRFFVDHMSGFPRRPPIFNSISDVLGPKDPRNGFDILSFWFPTKSSAPDSNKWFKAQTERPTRRCVLQTDRNRSCCPGLCERPSRHWTSHLDSEVRAVKKHPPPKKGWFHPPPQKKSRKKRWFHLGLPLTTKRAHHFGLQERPTILRSKHRMNAESSCDLLRNGDGLLTAAELRAGPIRGAGSF